MPFYGDEDSVVVAAGPTLLLARSSAALTHTGNTDETTVVTVSVPPIGASGYLRLVMAGTGVGSNAYNWTATAYLDGNAIGQIFGAAGDDVSLCTVDLMNHGVETAQTYLFLGGGAADPVIDTLAVNWATAKNITISLQTDDSGEVAVLSNYLIQTVPS